MADATPDNKRAEIIRRTLIAADMDRVADVISEVTGNPVVVHGITAEAGESNPNDIFVTFEGEILNRKRGEDGLYLEMVVQAKAVPRG